ncbi:MAG: hypothetical protein WB699_19220 [Bacteroidota bacterium]
MPDEEERALNMRALIFVLGVCLLAPRESAAGPPFKTDDPQPVDYRHWEFYIASQQSFAGTEVDATAPHFELNYGVIPNMQLHLVAPLAYVRTDQARHYGYSDTEVGVKYRFIEETPTIPQIGIFPLIEIPTGDANKDLGAGKVQAYFPVWIQKSWGKFTTYAGGGVWYNPGENRRNWIFTGWEAQYDLSETLTLGGEVFYQTADAVESEPTGGFDLGGYLNFGEHHHVLFSCGRNFSRDPSFAGYLGYQLTI